VRSDKRLGESNIQLKLYFFAAFRAASFFALAPRMVLLVDFFVAFADFVDVDAFDDFDAFDVVADFTGLASFFVFVLFVPLCGLLGFAASGGVPGISLPSPVGSLWANAS
jgi:hypothetical protein